MQSSSNTSVNLKHECKLETQAQIITKISEVGTKTHITTGGNPRYLEGEGTSPEAFRRQQKVIVRFPSTPEDHPNHSEDQEISCEHFETRSTITQTLPKIAQDVRRLLKISRSSPKALEVMQIFSVLEYQTHRSLNKQTMCRQSRELLTSNRMIILVQFGMNKYFKFARLKIELQISDYKFC